jgi:tRNA(Ile)-lysidine synthase
MPRRPPAVARVLERVTKTAREHEMFRPGDLVLVSCSGGPDSVCLLYSLWNLRRLFKIRLAVFHFDHKLRPDSAKDAAYVRNLAQRLALPFQLREAADRPGKGVSVEAWATVSRGNAANEVRKEIGSKVIAEGHTLDDQAESILLNLIRGGGLDAITGLWPNSGDGSGRYLCQVQPMIDVERAEVVAFCRALHLRPRRDPTNRETKYLRNALRLEGIPALEKITGREIKRSIARSGDLLRADREELHLQAVRAMGEFLLGDYSSRSFPMELDAAALRSLPDPIASRALRLAVYHVASSDWPAPWTKEAIEAILDLANGRPGRRRDLPNGLKAIREKEYVRVSRSSPPSPES